MEVYTHVHCRQKRYDTIVYNRCGKSGLKLPVVSLGLWHNFGDTSVYENMKQMCFTAFDNGITHFDLANNYGPAYGSAERNFGKLFREELHPYRNEMLISTKAGLDMWEGPYGNWGSRKYLIASLDQRLKRLGLDYVDIFYHHRMDPETPLEETMGALDSIVRSGIAVVDVNQYRSDMDCFIPLMNKFYTTYGFYPKYPVADAGYGSYNNYIFCEQHGMKKYMKFPMFKKKTTDKKYHEDPFRAVNFPIGKDGIMRCPNGKRFYLQYQKNVKGNKYGRQEEVYQCEDCSSCPYAEQCKKTDKNRTVRINRELTAMHQEVIENLESIQGALLRMNRSIQAEGTFGIMKNDRWYKRIVRRGIKSVLLEVFLVSIGHNLYKYHNKQKKRCNCRIGFHNSILMG